MTLELETFYGHLYRIDLAGDAVVAAYPRRGTFLPSDAAASGGPAIR